VVEPQALPPLWGWTVMVRVRVAVPDAAADPGAHFDWASHDHADHGDIWQSTGHASKLHVCRGPPGMRWMRCVCGAIQGNKHVSLPY
jgi:hypothetical protein